VLVPETAAGPAIIATPRILAANGGTPMLSVRVVVPIGGGAFELPVQNVSKRVSLVGAEGAENSIHEAMGESFVTGVADGQAILTTRDTGTGLAFQVSTEGGSDVGLDLSVDCALVDEHVPSRSVPGRYGLRHKLQLPTQRSVHLETVAKAGSGESLALAEIVGADDRSELIIFVTPTLVQGSSAPQVLVEATTVIVGRGGVTHQIEGATDRTRFLDEFRTQATEPNRGILGRTEEHSFVVGHPGGQPATTTLEESTFVEFVPTSLAPDEFRADVHLSRIDLGEPRRHPMKGPSGFEWIHLPRTRSLQVSTNVVIQDGQTIVLGGQVFQRRIPWRERRAETIVLATVNALGSGAVELSGRLAQVREETQRSWPGARDVERSFEENLFCAEVEPAP
jgi:hypothetical protein